VNSRSNSSISSARTSIDSISSHLGLADVEPPSRTPHCAAVAVACTAAAIPMQFHESRRNGVARRNRSAKLGAARSGSPSSCGRDCDVLTTVYATWSLRPVDPHRAQMGAAVMSRSSAGWLTTRLEFLANWARSNSLWQMPFNTACCGIEFMATCASRFDVARFGMERLAYTPRQADVLLCGGRLPLKLAPVIRRIYDQMPEPKWVIAMGACASTGGVFDTYAMVQGIDIIIPVDVYVPGCPPRPEALIYGILLLQKKVRGEKFGESSLRQERALDPGSLRIPPSLAEELAQPFGNSIHQTRSE